MQAARTYWATLEPFTRGFYINENLRGNYQRLVAIKQTHDPTNLFRLNANMQSPPA